MSGFLIDTNVISEYTKPDPNRKVIHWFESVDPAALFASVITLGEIRLGIENLTSSKRRDQLEEWLENGVPAWFQTNLLPVTKSTANHWGCIMIEARKKEIQLDIADGLIAATAFEHELVIVTRNTRDFEGLGIEIFNPWEI